MSEKVRYLKDVVIISVSTLFVKLRGLILVALLTKSLGAEAYGLWVQIAVTLALAASLSEINLHNSLIRYAAGETERQKISGVFWTNFTLVLVLSLIAASLLLFFSEKVSYLTFGSSGHGDFIRLMSPLIIIMSLNALTNAFFRAVHSTLWFAFYYTLTAVLDLSCIAIAIFASPGDISSALLGYIVAQAVVLVAMLVHISWNYGVSQPHLRDMKSYLLFILPTIPAMFADWMYNSSDRYFIVHFGGLTEVAIYNTAYLLAQLVMIPVLPINKVLLPTLVRFWEQKRVDQAGIFLAATLKYFLLVGIPAVFGLTALAGSVFPLLATQEFVSLGAKLIPILASGMLLYGASYIIMLIFYVSDKTGYIGGLSLFAGLANLLLNIWIVPLWGSLGAAVTSFVSYAIVFIGSLYLCRTIIPLKLDFSFMAKCAVISSLILGLSWLPRLNLPWLMTVVITVAVIYFFLIFLTSTIPENERLFLRNLLLNRGKDSS
jgi:O-antigen/teichoic acid export membrane protein